MGLLNMYVFKYLTCIVRYVLYHTYLGTCTCGLLSWWFFSPYLNNNVRRYAGSSQLEVYQGNKGMHDLLIMMSKVGYVMCVSYVGVGAIKSSYYAAMSCAYVALA